MKCYSTLRIQSDSTGISPKNIYIFFFTEGCRLYVVLVSPYHHGKLHQRRHVPRRKHPSHPRHALATMTSQWPPTMSRNYRADARLRLGVGAFPRRDLRSNAAPSIPPRGSGRGAAQQQRSAIRTGHATLSITRDRVQGERDRCEKVTVESTTQNSVCLRSGDRVCTNLARTTCYQEHNGSGATGRPGTSSLHH